VTHDAETDVKTSVPFIAMELVTGGSLAERMEREGKLPWPEASRLVVLLARALDYAHREGVVHRDMKPANVLLTPDGKPKIADFGIAKLQDAHLTKTGDVIGTPYYMSPEQLEGDEVDGRSDLFSLGSLFYALVAGRPPFVGPDVASITRQVLHKNPEPLSELVPDVPPDLDGVVGRALAKERSERYGSGGELAADVERVTRGEAPRRPLFLGEKTVESMKRAPTARRSRLPIFFLILVAAAGGYGAFAHWDEAEEVFRESRNETKRREELRARSAIRLEEAREEIDRGRWEEAERQIEESLVLSRDGNDGAREAEALLLRGILRAETGEWSKARADLESAASVFEIYREPNGKAKALLERANLERDLGSFDRAEAFYQELHGSDAVLERALLDVMESDFASAERRFQSITDGTASVQSRARAALYRGILAYARGEHEAAELLWSEASEGLGSPEVDLYRGFAALGSGRLEESKVIFEASLHHFEGLGESGAVESAREGLEGRTDEGPLRTVFLGEPRTKRSIERRGRLPRAVAP
jgi:tetratricopeptide (TPR) repeat protein